MPGIDLDLDLPTLSDSLTDIVTKVSTALSAIEDDLAGLVTSGAIDINAELSFNGQPLTNVGGVRLTGGESAVIGTLYMDGSDLWVMTSDGAVKLTAAGQVNIAGAGGIGGDYGSGDELVSYDLASEEYRFKADASTWADVVVDDVVLMGTGGGSVRLDVDAAITTTRSFKIKTLNAAGVSALVYDASASTLETADTKRATNLVQVTALNAAGAIVSTGSVTGTDLHHTADRHKRIPLHNGFIVTNASPGLSINAFSITNLGGGAVEWANFAGLSVGDRAKQISIRVIKSAGGDPQVSLYKRTSGDGSSTLVETFTCTTPGNNIYNLSVATPSVLAGSNTNAEDYSIHVYLPSASDAFSAPVLYWDRP